MSLLLERLGAVKNGVMTDYGLELFSEMLDCIGQYPNLTPGFNPSPHGIFEKLMSKTVPSCVELVLIRDGKVYLTYREDKFWKGYHVPGSYIAPGETPEQTSQRIASREVPGVLITKAEIVAAFTHPDSPRFHDTSLIVLAEFEGDPGEDVKGRWFSKRPDDLIDVHQPYWPVIEKYLK